MTLTILHYFIIYNFSPFRLHTSFYYTVGYLHLFTVIWICTKDTAWLIQSS